MSAAYCTRRRSKQCGNRDSALRFAAAATWPGRRDCGKPPVGNAGERAPVGEGAAATARIPRISQIRTGRAGLQVSRHT